MASPQHRSSDPNINAVLDEAEQLQLHLILQQRRAEKIAALKEYIGFEGEINDYFVKLDPKGKWTSLPPGTSERMEELWELNLFELAELSWAGNAALFGTPMSGWMHVWYVQKSGKFLQPGGYAPSLADGLTISDRQPHPAMVQKYEYLLQNVAYFLISRPIYYTKKVLEAGDWKYFASDDESDSLRRYLATCHYNLTWEEIVPCFTTRGQKVLEWLSEYWYSQYVWTNRFDADLCWMHVYAAIQVANYKQQEELANIPNEHRLFKTPDAISSLISGMISSRDERILREQLELEGKWEEYLFYQNLVVACDDGDSESGYQDEYPETTFSTWEDWMDSIKRKKDEADMEIALAALAALEDVHGE